MIGLRGAALASGEHHVRSQTLPARQAERRRSGRCGRWPVGRVPHVAQDAPYDFRLLDEGDQAHRMTAVRDPSQGPGKASHAERPRRPTHSYAPSPAPMA